MIRTGKRNIRSGNEFERFFTNSAKGDFVTVKKEATLDDTLSLMKHVVSDTLEDTKQIAEQLRGASEKETCNRIWNFCFSHFQYEKDEERKEQVRRPSRSWKDRKEGIDCDCLTVFIGSILTNLGIPFKMRMTRYKAPDFEHIYPVAKTQSEEVIIDCVVHQFNYEVPYTQKKDIEMELQYLNGVKQERYNEFGEKVSFENDLSIDAQDLFLDDMELQGLEGKAERKARKAKRKAKRAEKKKTPLKQRLKNGLKKGLHAINKVNPATALLRAGVLASMKLNIMKVASHLRFSYWTDDEARRNSMDMGKFNQLKRIREKMEKIFHGAGGKKKNLKKSILTGKGNRNKMVQLDGLGSIISFVDDDDDLRTILGEDLFFDEELNDVEAINGLSGLGGVSAAVGAASGVIATIAKIIKKLGGLFKKGSAAAEKFKIQDNTDNAEEGSRKFSFKNIANFLKNKIGKKKASESSGKSALETIKEEQGIEDDFLLDDTALKSKSQEIDVTDDESDPNKKKGIGAWIKANPVPTALIAIGVAGGTYLGIRAIKKSKKKKGLSGAPKSTRKKPSGKKFVPRSRGKKKKPTTSKVPKVELL